MTKLSHAKRLFVATGVHTCSPVTRTTTIERVGATATLRLAAVAPSARLVLEDVRLRSRVVVLDLARSPRFDCQDPATGPPALYLDMLHTVLMRERRLALSEASQSKRQ